MQLQIEYRQLYCKNWDRQIEKLDVEQNPKTFWTSVKKLQGTGDKIKASYIKDHYNQTVYDKDKKENIFRQYWRNIFNISEDENRDFDQKTDTLANDFLAHRQHNLTPYQNTDLNRTDPNFDIVTREELDYTIN